MNNNILTGFIFFLCGVFSIFCSVKNYDWFLNNRKAYLIVKIAGRNGARIFYSVLGTIICIFGLIFAFGIIK